MAFVNAVLKAVNRMLKVIFHPHFAFQCSLLLLPFSLSAKVFSLSFIQKLFLVIEIPSTCSWTQ